MSDKNKGLFHKFYVARIDGRDYPGGDRENAKYFVLDYVNDLYALSALACYAAACEEEYPLLAKDLREKIDNQIDGENNNG